MQRSIRDPTCPWVFFRDGGVQVRSFRDAWHTACAAAGLVFDKDKPYHRFHDLRRSGVRNLIRAGVPEVVAMRISGHKTRSIFDRYNIVSERDLQEAAQKLDAYMKSQREQFGHNLGTVAESNQTGGSANTANLLDPEDGSWSGGMGLKPLNKISEPLDAVLRHNSSCRDANSRSFPLVCSTSPNSGFSRPHCPCWPGWLRLSRRRTVLSFEVTRGWSCCMRPCWIAKAAS
jgi:hypothetical protein